MTYNIYIFGVFMSISMIALSQTSDPLDSIFPKPQIYGVDTYSYLIKDNSLYDFLVKDIISLKNAYVIELQTTIDATTVGCFVVSPKNNNYKGVKIQKGQHYNMSLRRYNIIPARVSIESVTTVDFLFGNRLASVNEDGTFKYVFCSPTLIGDRIKNQYDIDRENHCFARDSLGIVDYMQSFISLISKNFSQNQLYSIIDTVSMKKIFGQYSVYVQGRSPKELLCQHQHVYPWSIYHSPQKHYSKREIRNRSTYELFYEVISNEYRLPDETCSLDSIQLLDIDLLYSCDTSSYTIRVIWENAILKKKYVAVCSLQKKDNYYVLTGFNKPYRGYRLYVRSENKDFVPMIKYH